MARARTTSIVLLLFVASIVVDGHATLAADAPQAFPSTALWTREVKALPIAPPVASADRLYLALQSGILALRLADGTPIWESPFVVEGSMAASDDRLILVAKGELQALDASTGSVVWTDRPGPLTAPPLVSGEWLLVASGEAIICYRAADGTRVWTQETGLVEQRPAVEGTRVYVPAADGRVLALDLKSGKQAWEYQIGIKPTEPLVYGGRVFVGAEAKQMCSIKPETGEKDWCFGAVAGVVGRPVADATHVYYVALDNILRANDRRQGALRWKKDLKYRPSSGPLLIGSNIAVPGNVPRVQVFDTKRGDPGIQLTLATRLATAPLLIDATEQSPARIAALTGGLQQAWTVTLAGPAPPIPAIAVEPIKELPGQAIPIGWQPIAPAPQPPAF